VTELSDLPPARRIERYRELAEQARLSALRTEGEIRQAYLLLARQWAKLARDTAERLTRE